MKNFLFVSVMAISAAFVSCTSNNNSGAPHDTTSADSVIIDSLDCVNCKDTLEIDTTFKINPSKS